MTDSFEILGNKIEFKNIDQVMRMGGPFVGELIINNKAIEGRFIVNTPKISSDYKLLLVSKYHKKSNWLSDNYFTIVVIQLDDFNAFESNTKSKIVFIESIEANLITYYEAATNELDKYKKTINYIPERFKKI